MKFIVFEGLEGSGKTTQLRLLAEILAQKDIPHITTRQPSDNPIGTLMRTVTDGFLPMENETMALLVAADRYQHVCHEIIPALHAGKWVLCDRYYYSSFACQGVDPCVFSRIADYNALVMASCKPDITFFLDVQPQECLRRIQTNRNYGGMYDSLTQLTQIRMRYEKIFDKLNQSDKIIHIDGNTTQENVTAQILKHLSLY